MTENDYIAEYIKEKHASLLGFDFAMWKMWHMVKSFIRATADIVKTVIPEDLKKLTEDKDAEADNGTEIVIYGVRDCDTCIHYVTKDGHTGCECWECEYEGNDDDL